jgi:predicted transcriptional regulator with HTH domain
MPFLIFFLSFFLSLTKGSQTVSPINQSDSAKDLALFLRKYYPANGYPIFTFLSELKEAITKDPLKPHSPEIILKINESYNLHPLIFMMVIKALDNTELILHVCLMMKKYFEYESYVHNLKRCYLMGSYEIDTNQTIQLIFNRFDQLIRSQMKRAFVDPTKRDNDLKSRKRLAHLMLSILQRVSFSPSVKVEIYFACQKLSTRSYFMIMKGTLSELILTLFGEPK